MQVSDAVPEEVPPLMAVPQNASVPAMNGEESAACARALWVLVAGRRLTPSSREVEATMGALVATGL